MATTVLVPARMRVGMGTYRMKGDVLRTAVRTAIEIGYRSIDSAQVYRNESDIGEVLDELFKEGRLRRDQISITSKIAPKNAGSKAYNSVLESLQKLKLEYIDLMLIHWPGSQGLPLTSAKNLENRIETWRALERLQREGKVRSIGVSNYTVKHLTELLGYAEIMPSVNQFEIHPLYPNTEVVQFCQANNIQVQAYSSLGEGFLLDATVPEYSVISTVGDKHSATRAQVLLKWALQHGYWVIPKSSSEARLRENINLDTFTLTSEEMTSIDNLTTQVDAIKFCWDPLTVT